MKEAQSILKNLKSGQFAPIYFLHGEESYYIDLISNYIEKHALDEAAKGFNQVVVYGRDARCSDIVNHAKRFPMMSDRQVVIVKEAQNISDLNKDPGQKMLSDYAMNPLPSTILVLCHKHKKVDKRKVLYKTMSKHAVMLETKKLWDNQVPDWIRDYFRERDLKITDKSVYMLAEFIGNNLERLSNEIDKMLINFTEKVEIDENIIQKHVGISKDYNSFELQRALAYREIVRANKIVNYFEANPKSNPVIPVIAILYAFFSKVLKLHSKPGMSDREIAGFLKISPFASKEYVSARKNYPPQKLISIIGSLRHADLQSKGVVASNLPDGQILKELVFKIFH